MKTLKEKQFNDIKKAVLKFESYLLSLYSNKEIKDKLYFELIEKFDKLLSSFEK